MAKTRDLWFRRGGNLDRERYGYTTRNSPWFVTLYGTAGQVKKREHLKEFCYSTFCRMTGVSLKPGEVKHVRATFEVIKEQEED